jgi:hypothetical protein
MFSRLNIGFLFMPFHYGILLLENVVIVPTTKVLRHAQICLLYIFCNLPKKPMLIKMFYVAVLI